MNENAAGTQVQLDFTDQNGKAHTLIRNRNGDKNALLLDSYTISQTDIDRMQANKISIHGNLYFIPNPYLPLLNILEDYIDAISKHNLNDDW